MDPDRVERLLGPELLADLGSLPMQELRARRAECQELEVALSFQRRMAQGRLDIVGAERRRRATPDAPPRAHEDLVNSLTGILADRVRAPGLGRLPQLLAPDPTEVETDDLDAIVGPGTLASLPTLDDVELDELVRALSEYEAEVSRRRKALHARIDTLQAEITRRYRDGEASVDSLLG